MQNFLISFEVVFPIFIMMALGFFLRRIKLFNDVTVKQMNAAVFRVFLPVMLFKNVYQSSISEVFNGRLLLFALIAAVACVVFAFLIVPLLTKENTKRGALIQGIFRSNFAIFGLPVAVTLCGETSAAVAAILIATVIPLYNVLAVVTLEVFGSKRGGFGKTVKGIAKNPLIIASLLGLIANLIGLKLPTFMEAAVSNV
ncbi:MAG: AEC family transporter, partial [Clostridia bacterium]|nr:AEC family transporter [Clostridia bacterium]